MDQDTTILRDLVSSGNSLSCVSLHVTVCVCCSALSMESTMTILSEELETESLN